MNAHPSALTLRELVQHAARSNPDAPAFLAPGRRPLTHARLLELIEDVHRQLYGFGLRPADRVALALPNGVEAATAFVAISASAASVPFNPEYPQSEWAAHLAGTKAKAVVVAAGTAPHARAAARDLELLILELTADHAAEAGWFSLKLRADSGRFSPDGAGANTWPAPGDVALVLPTSGSTARPKLVPLSQAGLCLTSANTARSIGLTHEDRHLNMLPLRHVHGLVSGILVPLDASGSVAVTPGFDAEQFLDWLAAFKPTWITAPPAMCRAMLEQALKPGAAPAPARLRFLRTGSAPLGPGLLQQLEAAFSAPMIEAYGMTEVPHISANPLDRRKPGSVGRPVVQELAILDEQGAPAPPGHTGEICVRGPTVTPGYEADASANAAVFIGGWFHTGDLGWLDEEGYLFLAGRAKEIINRGGQKVSPREIDEILQTHPAVREAATFAVPHATLGEDIAAAVVPAGDAAPGEAELREFALQRLPGFKVPSRIVVVREIPRLRTGKIPRLELADRLSAVLAIPHEIPRPGAEQHVAAIFETILQRPRVGRQDNFFALGGDSLRGAQVVSRLRRVFDVELPVQALFECPTVAGLASAIERHVAGAGVAKPQPIPRLRREEHRAGPNPHDHGGQ